MNTQNNWIKGALFLGFYIGAFIVLLTSCSSTKGTDEGYASSRVSYPTFTLADSLMGGLTPLRTSFDVTHYDLSLDVDIEQKFLSGSVDIYFNVVNDLDSLQLDLYHNMQIENIQLDNNRLPFNRVHNAVFVAFPQTLSKGSRQKITVHYKGSPKEAKDIPWKGGFVWGNDDAGKPWVTVACEYEGASLWWPLKDHRSDKPDSISMQISVPKGLFCVSSGKLIKQQNSNQKSTFTWKTSYPTNTDNTVLYIGDFTHFQIPYTSPLSSFNMDFYVLGGNTKEAQKRFQQTTEVMATFENLFGAYPWTNDGFKLVESPHKKAISAPGIQSEAKPDAAYKYDRTIVQKTAREWWGNSLSVKDLSDVWIRESFALYSEALFLEQKEGKAAYMNYLTENFQVNDHCKPLVGPKNVNYWDSSDPYLAMKGANVLHTLRNKINNDDSFLNILQQFYTQNAYMTVTTDDFTRMVNELTQEDFHTFFDQYLYSNVCPGLEWQYLYNRKLKKEYVFYRWKNVDENFDLPILVQTSNVTFRIRPELNIKAIEIPAGDTIFMNTTECFITLDYNKNMIKYQQ